ncbi:MAG: transketolase [Rhodospirillaceae bacterium]|nr:transketolase [Rhodospirillaceae bacterium]
MAQAALKTVSDRTRAVADERDLRCLAALERKVNWLSAWTIHNANHIRPSRDGIKVGGHQASSASLATIMTALYFKALRPYDRVAVKPHASPVYHAIQYLFGRQTQEKLERFRGFGGAQSYPSRTKDTDDVDISTGSVGLGGAMTVFSSIVQDYLSLHEMIPAERSNGRMVALFGDAELDEGNVFEALLEGWKHELRNTWWIIDYNRQSLDSVVTDRLFNRFEGLFQSMGWDVITLKYGKLLQAAAKKPGGEALLQWIDNCPNQLYSALTFKGGAAWRDHLTRSLGDTHGIKELLDSHDDDALQALMTNLAGHDMESVLEAFDRAGATETPTAIIAYTIKGYGLPFAGHKDNHAGLMNPGQMEQLRQIAGVPEGKEWDKFAGLDIDVDELQSFIAEAPFLKDGPRRFDAPKVPVPERLSYPPAERSSTQEAFGRILNDLGKGDSPLADRIVTTSPDVTVSTNLGGWVNQRQIFDRTDRPDTFRDEKVVSAQKWVASQAGQHVELGIAENNLFLNLAAFGLSGPMFGTRLLPIGTLYDPFISRGLDALNYACYQDSRFLLVATPSGITLAPEGGAHQSISTPLIGMGQPGLTSFEPAYVDELAAIMRWSFEHMQDDAHGGSVYLRLSTRTLDQPSRELTPALETAIIDGGYWQREPEEGAELALVYSGAIAPEVLEAFETIAEDVPGAGVLAVPSGDRLHAGWLAARRARQTGSDEVAPVERLLGRLSPNAALVTILDGHPASLSWMGSVHGHRVSPLGIQTFGQSGDLQDLYHAYRLDAEAILDTAAQACLTRRR